MAFTDRFGSDWSAYRQVLPWQVRLFGWARLRRFSMLDGSNDIADFLVGIALFVVLALPGLLELVVELIVFPFVFLFRLAGVVKTPVGVACVEKMVGDTQDSQQDIETADPEHYRTLIRGFRRAISFRDALVEHVREKGRSVDASQFAEDWLATHS